MSLLPQRLVDALPQAWWAVGNLHRLAGTARTWHFCLAHGLNAASVRSIDVLDTQVAWGRKAFDFQAAQRDGERLALRQEQDESK